MYNHIWSLNTISKLPVISCQQIWAMSSQSYQLSFGLTLLILIVSVFFLLVFIALIVKIVSFVYQTLTPGFQKENSSSLQHFPDSESQNHGGKNIRKRKTPPPRSQLACQNIVKEEWVDQFIIYGRGILRCYFILSLSGCLHLCHVLILNITVNGLMWKGVIYTGWPLSHFTI